jgi:2-amino-4-hydroxy-6-hydroxymethyldihydropteridine diphosphokinase
MKTPEHQACLLLGSNIQPEQNLTRAVVLLQKQVTILQVSSVWETSSVGSGGPNFLNAAICVLTPLEAYALKEQVLRPLEAQMGRVRSANKNAPRTIDLDIIIFDGQLLDPTLWLYAHRAVPVAEVLPDYQFETGEYLKDAALHLVKATPIRLRSDVTIQAHL